MRGMVIPTTFTAINRFSGPVGSMTRSMAGFIGTSQMYASSVGRVFRGALKPMADFQNALRSIGVYFGLFSVFMILRNAVKVLADFDREQVNIKSVIGENIKQMPKLALQARQMAVSYGVAADEVARTQYELIKLGLPDRPGGFNNVLQSTPAVIGMARAQKGANVDEVAQLLGAGTSLFKHLSSDGTRNGLAYTAMELADIYNKALDLTALDWESFSTMMKTSQQVWAKSGRGPEELAAVLGVLRNAFIHAASAGTGLKNMGVRDLTNNRDFQDQLKMISESPNAIKTIYKLYGQKTLQAVLPLSENISSIEDLVHKLETKATGYTDFLAETKLQSIYSKMDLVTAAYKELIFTADDSGNAFSNAIKSVLDISRAMLLISSGSSVAREALSKMDTTIVELANKYLGWLETAWKVVKVLLYLKAIMLVVNAILWISRAAWIATSIGIGIFTAMTGIGTMALRHNAIAMLTANIATKAWAAGLFLARGAMQLLNLVIAGNPLGLLIIGLGVVLANLVSINSEWSIWADNIQKMKTEKDRGIMEDFMLQFNDKYRSGLREIGKKNPEYSRRQADSVYVATQNMKYDSAMARMNPMAGLDSLGEKNDLSFLNAKNNNSLRDSEISNQKQNVTIDINNNTGNKLKSKQSGGNGVPVRIGSTWMFSNYGESGN